MHGTARFIGDRLGHEGCHHIVLERRLAQSPLEHENLVGQRERVAVTEIDLHLGGPFLMDQRIDIQPLGFAPVVHILEQGIKLVGRINGEGLAPRFLASAAPNRWLQR